MMPIKKFGIIAAIALPVGMASEASAQRITIVTNQQGSLAYSTGAGLAKVINEKLGAQARIQPTGGSSTFMPLLDRGEAQYGFVSSLEAIFAQTGTELYKGRPQKNVRIVAELIDLLQGIIVRADSSAQSIADLKGMSIGARFTSQQIVAYTQKALLANGGIDPNAMKGVPVINANGAIMGVGQGKIDTSFAPPGSGVVQNAHAAASSAGGIRFIPVNESPEAIARMQAVIPSANVRRIKPAPNYPGVKEEIAVMSYPFVMIAGADVSDESVYKLVKMMHGSKDDLAKAFAAFRRFNPKNMARMKDGNFHPGAIRFYKEAGLWTR